MNSHGSPTDATESTSCSLLERAKVRDPAAWQKLTNVYSPLVYQWCRHAGLQTSDAADIVQEVFRSVAGAVDGFRRDRPSDSFRGWLWTITKNKIRDLFRRRGDQPIAQGGTAAQVKLRDLPGEAPEDSDETSRLAVRTNLARRAMSVMQDNFEERTWRAFWQAAVEHQPAADVAQDLGISVAAVYMAKSRVLRRLREELDGLDLID